MSFRYARYDGDGRILGVQTTHEALDPVPEFWLPVPEGVSGSTHYVLDGVVCPYSEPEAAALAAGPPALGYRWYARDKVWVDVRSLDEVRRDTLRSINEAFERAAAKLTAGYPPAEKLTWGIQQAEALAWKANPSAPTPYLDGLAQARGIDPLDMRQRTATKVAAFMEASKTLVGMRQALEAAIEAATDRAQLEQICWPQAI